MLKVFFLFLISAFWHPHTIHSLASPTAVSDSGMVNGIHYIFKVSDTSYSFLCSFYTQAKIECLMNVSYQLKYKQQYNKQADRIEMLSDHGTWYMSRFYLSKFSYLHSTSDWITSIDKTSGQVNFKMLRQYNNVKAANIIRSSSGYYRFTPGISLSRVEYYQQCTVTRGLVSRLYLDNAREEMLKYVQNYRSFAEKSCSNSR